MYTQRSFHLNPNDVDRKWYIIDATDCVVGRLATEIATVLRGKNKPTYTPSTDCGDFIVVTNAEKVQFTGSKWDNKNYHWHTGYIGGLKTRTAREQLEKHPELILEKAVKGMLPKNALSRKQMTKLKIYTGDAHPHDAQKPEVLKFN